MFLKDNIRNMVAGLWSNQSGTILSRQITGYIHGSKALFSKPFLSKPSSVGGIIPQYMGSLHTNHIRPFLSKPRSVLSQVQCKPNRSTNQTERSANIPSAVTTGAIAAAAAASTIRTAAAASTGWRGGGRRCTTRGRRAAGNRGDNTAEDGRGRRDALRVLGRVGEVGLRVGARGVDDADHARGTVCGRMLLRAVEGDGVCGVDRNGEGVGL